MPNDSIMLRDAVMRGIRAFFLARDFTEVETPIRLKIPCMELHIDAEPSGTRFLRTSPEIYHKQLIARGHDKIFEIGKCFRRGELGPLHNPEYTMLEWYRANADYMDMLEDTKALIRSVAGIDLSAVASAKADEPTLSNDWKILTVSAAVLEFAGWDPVGHYAADRFDIDLVEKIDQIVFLFKGQKKLLHLIHICKFVLVKEI